MATKRKASRTDSVEGTRQERMVRAIRNHPVTALLIVLGVTIIGISQTADAVGKIFSTVNGLRNAGLVFDVDVTTLRDTLNTPSDLQLRYAASESGAVINITPHMPVLSNLSASGPVKPVYCDAFIEMEPYPVLDLKLLNNGRRSVYITDITFEVDSSRPVRGAVALIDSADPYFTLPLCNVGWDAMKSVRIDFNLANVADSVGSTKAYVHHLRVDDVHDQLGVDLSDALSAEGVDMNVLASSPFSDSLGTGRVRRDGTRIYGSQDEERARVARALGKFLDPKDTLYPDGPARVYGVLSYTDSDTPVAAAPRKQLRFDKMVPLYRWGEAGGVISPSATYDVKLQTEGEHYSRKVSVSHALEPGKADRLQLRVAANRSSIHRLRLALRSSDGSVVRSRETSLNIFVPRLPEWAARDTTSDRTN
jgi:hypothetical protein